MVIANYTPAAAADDCSASKDSWFNTTAGNMKFGYPIWTSNGEMIGMRFMTCTIPVGAVIVYAHITLRVADPFTATFPLYVEAKTEGPTNNNPATYTTSYNEFIARSLNGSGISYVIDSPLAIGNDHVTPDIGAMIQEVIDNPNWASGQAIAFRMYAYLEDEIGMTPTSVIFTGYAGGATDPKLTVCYYVPTVYYAMGRSKTCLDECYVVNKHNQAQPYYISVWNDGAASHQDFLPGGQATIHLLPTIPFLPSVGDCLYIGILETVLTCGPFTNVVFNITTAQVGITGAWQYWNGAWTTIPDLKDDTNQFLATGVHSICFAAPMDWVVNDWHVGSGYWIRYIVTAIAGGGGTGAIQTGDIYSVLWPYVEIAADQVTGDIPAIAKITLRNRGTLMSGMYATYTNRIIAGLRSVDRGADFSAYLNFSDEQNPVGITAVTNSDDGTMVNNMRAPTGRCIRLRPDATAEDTAGKITISKTVAKQYCGTYRVFLRAYVVTTKTPFQYFWLEVSEGGSIIASTPHVFLPYLPITVPLQLDLGQLSLYPRFGGSEWAGIDIRLKTISDTFAAHGVGDPDTYIIDLILMPTDEWCGDFNDASEYKINILLNSSVNDPGYYLDMDSITNPKAGIIVPVRRVSDDTRTGAWQYISNSNNILLQANKQQRLWFLGARTNPIETSVYCMPDMLHSVQIYKNQRYFSARGSR